MSSASASAGAADPAAAFGQHVMAQEVERSFVQQCMEQERELKEEEDALRSMLANILEQAKAPALDVPGAGILYLKTTESERRLTLERIGETLDALRENGGAALREAYGALRREGSASVRAADVITLAIVRQLHLRCVTQRQTPTVAKRIPQQLKASSVAPRPVDGGSAVPATVGQYLAVQAQLRAVRKHKCEGRKRCREVTDMSALQIQQLLSTMGDGAEQVVRVVPAVSGVAAAAAASPPTARRLRGGDTAAPQAAAAAVSEDDDDDDALPAMPVLLPDHAERDAERRSSAARRPRMLEVQVPHVTTESIVRFRQRMPTSSRARAPRLKEFTHDLVKVVSSAVGTRSAKDEDVVVALLQADDVFARLSDALADRFTQQSTPTTPAVQAPKLSVRRL